MNVKFEVEMDLQMDIGDGAYEPEDDMEASNMIAETMSLLQEEIGNDAFFTEQGVAAVALNVTIKRI
jgi:hypothetical protein